MRARRKRGVEAVTGFRKHALFVGQQGTVDFEVAGPSRKARQQVTGSRPRAALVVSRAITGTNLASAIEEYLSSFGLPVLEGTRQRVAYPEALGTGRGVQDLSPSSKAAEEIEQLTADVEHLLN